MTGLVYLFTLILIYQFILKIHLFRSILISPDNLDEDADKVVQFTLRTDEHPKISGQIVLPR